LACRAGTFASTAIGWHATFGVLSALALGLVVWIVLGVPDFPGLAPGKRASVRQALANVGVRAVLVITFTFVLAHNILYTYIAPFVARAGMGERVDLVLLVFGFAAIAGIWVIGLWVDRRLRPLILASSLIFAAAALALGLAGRDPVCSSASRPGGSPSAAAPLCSRPRLRSQPATPLTSLNRCWS
jgi:predicted MFS family arabinose efflux permease